MNIKTLLESANMFAAHVKDSLGLEQFSLFERENNDLYLNSIIVGKDNRGRGFRLKGD